MIMAVMLATLLGLGLDEILLRASAMRVGKAVLPVTLLMTAALALTFLLLRFMLKGAGSPVPFAMTRREQQRMWAALDGAGGTWTTISIKPISAVLPDYAFTATVWQTAQGWFFRAEDAYALARYHAWAGNHLAFPVAAFHLHRVSVFAGDTPRVRRGMRVTATTRRLWWLDAWRSHRDIPALDAEDGSPERKAGLLLIGTDDLRRAGLNVVQRASLGDDRDA